MAARSDAILARPSSPKGRGVLRTARRVANFIGTAISVVVVMAGAAGIVVAIGTHLARDGQYALFGHPTMIVLSGSMSPAIRTGDLIFDDPVGGDQAQRLQVGQIISFRLLPTATPITHRIVQVTSTDGQVAYVTKGDANTTADAVHVLPAQIVGVYHTKIPDGGYVLNALHQPLTLALLLASPALWFLSGLFFGWARAAAVEERAAQPPTDGAEEDGER